MISLFDIEMVQDRKHIVRKVKLTKTRSNPVSIILITFEQIEIKMSIFRRFVARQLVVLVHWSKVRIHAISIKRQSFLSR